MEKRKGTTLFIKAKRIIFNQKHRSYTFKLPLIKFSWLDKYLARKNVAISKRYILTKSPQKLKSIFGFHDPLPKFFF